MPLRGLVAIEYVFPNLLRVMNELDGSPTLAEVGMPLRDEAVASVRKGIVSGK